MPIENYSRFKKDGGYSTSQGTDELQGNDGVSIAIDPSYEGMSDYKEGDEVDLKIKARVGAVGDDGKTQLSCLMCEVEPMQGDAKKMRNDTNKNMPPPSTLDDQEGE